MRREGSNPTHGTATYARIGHQPGPRVEDKSHANGGSHDRRSDEVRGSSEFVPPFSSIKKEDSIEVSAWRGLLSADDQTNRVAADVRQYSGGFSMSTGRRDTRRINHFGG